MEAVEYFCFPASASAAPDVNHDLEFDFSSKKKKPKKKMVDIEKLIADDEKEDKSDEKEKGELPLTCVD